MTQVTAGDWIRALEDDSIGHVVAVTDGVAEVAWDGGVRVAYHLGQARYEVYGSRSEAEAARERDQDAHGMA